MIKYPQCPSCKSSQLRRYSRASTCRICGNTCLNDKLIQAPDVPDAPAPIKHKGSGVIAGKIEIHGFRYGGGVGFSSRKSGAL